MGKTLWNKQLLHILRREDLANPRAESLTPLSQINCHIKDGSFNHSNKFCLRALNLVMHPAKDTFN